MTDTLTGLLTERLAPWLSPQVDPEGAHLILLSAKAAMAEQLFSLVWDQGDPDDPGYQAGWTTLFDVDLCPTQFLPFLAQIVGVSIPTGTDDGDARQIIRSEQGMQRGTPATIIAVAKRFLSGTQSVFLVERTTANGTADAYRAVLIFLASECANQTALEAAVEAVKPAGIQITYVASTGFEWVAAIHTWSADTFSWSAAAGTQP